MIRPGFVLLTHRDPPQIQRLVHALNALYHSPPIVIHHDFDQCALNGFVPPPNLTFVDPHIETAWGEFSLVSATIEALRTLLRSSAPPDWFTVLSESDYPVRSAEEALADLARPDCDACLRFEEIDPLHPGRRWQKDCIERYYRFDLPIPYPTPHGFRINYHRVRQPRLVRFLSPYSRSFRCFAGSQWFSARLHVAERLVAWHDQNAWLRQHLEDRWFSDETYFQSVLCNDPKIRVHNGNFRYVDWSTQDSHPKILGMEDIPAIQASQAHFARKFEAGSPALDHFDRLLGI